MQPPKTNSLRNKYTNRNAVDIDLGNFYYYYTIDVKIGTPPQSVELLIDTGSSDVWMMSEDNPLCETEINCNKEIFESNASSTYYLESEGGFQITYGDGTVAEGDYFGDVLRIGDAVLQNATMGKYRVLSGSGAIKEKRQY